MNHFHILWANSDLDWEPFPTEEEAKVAAEQLKRLDENYVIEKRGGDCPRCAELMPHALTWNKR
jgi:hypothetical protein